MEWKIWRYRPGAIREIRKQQGLTVVECSDTLGLVVQAWFRWEKGEVTPSAENIGLICFALSTASRIITPSDLYEQ